MTHNKWWLLQLFADGGEGSAAGSDSGAASDTGVTDAAAGHQRLRELGVPESKIRKNRSYKVAAEQKPAEAEQVTEQKQEPTVQDDAAKTPPEADNPRRMTWDEIKADPEYSQQMQKMMQERVKKYRGSDAAMATLSPALDELLVHYGLDVKNPDYGKLAEMIQGDTSRYGDRANELGIAPEEVRKMDMGEIAQARRSREEAADSQDQALQIHYAGIRRQAETFAQKCPGFDLDKELENPAFVKLTAPGVAFSVEDAYNFVHREEIAQAAMRAATEDARKNMANAIRSGTMRPAENGSNSAAPSVTTIDWRTASPQQRQAMRDRIRLAEARGEKLYPGQF